LSAPGMGVQAGRFLIINRLAGAEGASESSGQFCRLAALKPGKADNPLLYFYFSIVFCRIRPQVEGRAQDFHHSTAGSDPEGAGRIVPDIEISFAGELDAAFGTIPETGLYRQE